MSKLSIEYVRSELAEKSRLGFTPQIKEIINSLGAKKLTDVRPSDYEFLLNKVKEVKSGEK